ncbi:MgtC/SapB family protein [Thermosynechococcaceae cyanobacterium BACA0444]|uniref:MgtC/SapB family protein n=1 Tax=Pseudocalidococcus azoricus BACA0444 TaxID=2918990 RepID=A0AAE4JYW1_9CYAN|nr:MgtC/SapB family protein [Pseudocalidococcus azoricus]MDS3861419.1 MgtC/SapB family protein [Pseudocalidococcus azoricus BACA0444]
MALENTLFFSPDDIFTISLRLGMAFFVGGAIGLNRQQPGRPAGLRTYMAVSVGSALFVMLPLQAGIDLNSTNALSRTVQGVATGVGFIGAGLILQQSSHGVKPEVKGLTSAAALWLTAGLGTAAGCGLWITSLVGTLMTLMILSGVKRMKQAPLYQIHIYGKGRKKKSPTKSKNTPTAATTIESDNTDH